MTRSAAVPAAALALAATLATGFTATAHAQPNPDAHATGGLVVTPGSALFDVELAQGVPEAREVTLTNTSAIDLDVQLSVLLSAGAPEDHRLEHLRLHATSDYASCDDTILDGAAHLAFTEVQRVDQEAVPAGSTRTVCIGVLLPMDAPIMDAATTIVDFQFHSFDARTTPGGGDDGLSTTGVDSLRFLPTALLAVLTGALLFWSARRRNTSHAPTPKAPR
ncbi:hypothetical protein ACL9RL_18030 [Plantibacter sp. Mn2098]|uniref:hypothetical protein n=1 Tax=Plantibacter sp. Mn2098 TaxID=3395266 RepID=UPI003BC159EC